MKPPGFDYHRADNLEHACELLSACGEGAKILAGGQSLIPMMNFRLARPRVLIDISNIADSNQVCAEPGGIRIRATTVQRVVENALLVQEKLPLLCYAIKHVAHTQIRNKGTLGGSIANADPASELPAMCLALDAQLEVRKHGARRTLPAAELFVTYMTTALDADEIISSVLFAEPPGGSGWGFHELARRSGDYALAGSAAVITLDGANKCTRARIALFGVAATPVRAIDAEDSLLGQVHSASRIKDAAHLVQGVLEPEGDMHVTAAYRRSVAEVLTVRALDDAFQRAAAAR